MPFHMILFFSTTQPERSLWTTGGSTGNLWIWLNIALEVRFYEKHKKIKSLARNIRQCPPHNIICFSLNCHAVRKTRNSQKYFYYWKCFGYENIYRVAGTQKWPMRMLSGNLVFLFTRIFVGFQMKFYTFQFFSIKVFNFFWMFSSWLVDLRLELWVRMSQHTFEMQLCIEFGLIT